MIDSFSFRKNTPEVSALYRKLLPPHGILMDPGWRVGECGARVISVDFWEVERPRIRVYGAGDGWSYTLLDSGVWQGCSADLTDPTPMWEDKATRLLLSDRFDMPLAKRGLLETDLEFLKIVEAVSHRRPRRIRATRGGE